MSSPLVEALSQVVSLPTAPFYEGRVQAFARKWAAERGIPLSEDPHGNLLLRWAKSTGPALAFVAHMDHPGLEVMPGQGRVAARVFGGLGPRDLTGTPVRVFGKEEVRARVAEDSRRVEPGRGRSVSLDVEAPITARTFGMWDLKPFALSRGMVRARVIDDLAGVAAILALFARLAERDVEASVYGLLTRAEEVGFIGAHALARTGLLPREVPVISIEMSRALPLAEQGKGFVVRVGDRLTLFDPDLTQYMIEVAGSIAAREKTFAHQKRILDGGACEASLFRQMGHRVGGLAVPLGNYHNLGRTGIAPENIALADYESLVRFLEVLAADYARGGEAEARLRVRDRVLAGYDAFSDRMAPSPRRRRATPRRRVREGALNRRRTGGRA